MKHIDEHTIELYILGSDLVKGQIGEIETHLDECHGCRALADRMSAFYKNAEENLEKFSTPAEPKSKALVRFPKDLMEYDIPMGSRVPYKPTTTMAKFWYFVYKHPISSTVGGFTMIAVIGWLLNDAFSLLSPKDEIKDKNPAHYTYNISRNTLDIQNKSGQTLWNLSIWRAEAVEKNDLATNIPSTKIIDLGSDNISEIVTTVSLKDKDLESRAKLRIYNHEGNELKEVNVDEDIVYGGEKYLGTMVAGAFQILANRISGQKEIFYLAINGRSPCKVVRTDNIGNILGSYYHYGFVRPTSVLTANGDLLLQGIDDNVSQGDLSLAVLIILDPLKIDGRSKSVQAPGFNMKVSDAEKIYVRILPNEISRRYHVNQDISRVLPQSFEGKNALKVDVSCMITDTEPFVLEYIFSEDLHLLNIKQMTLVGDIASRIKRDKRLTSITSPKYREELMREIQYWNGKSWQNGWTMISHDVESTSQNGSR